MVEHSHFRCEQATYLWHFQPAMNLNWYEPSLQKITYYRAQKLGNPGICVGLVSFDFKLKVFLSNLALKIIIQGFMDQTWSTHPWRRYKYSVNFLRQIQTWLPARWASHKTWAARVKLNSNLKEPMQLNKSIKVMCTKFLLSNFNFDWNHQKMKTCIQRILLNSQSVMASV